MRAAARRRDRPTEGAKVIDPTSMDGAKGEITYCAGKDTAAPRHDRRLQQEVRRRTSRPSSSSSRPTADEQRNQFIQRQQAKSGDCDVFSSDVIWTAEFASQKWLYDMTPYIEGKKADFIEAPIETITYDGKIWGSPESTDAGFLYYSNDKVKEVPGTWQEVYEEAADDGGIVYQGAAYEGLTCDFLELSFAAGGEVLSEDGTKADDRPPANARGAEFMADGIKDGAAPKAVTTYMEPESLPAFQTGKYAYMRNWPYAYALNQKASEVKDNFDVAPQPEFEGGGKAGILGGHNSVISVYSKNPGAALKLVDFIGSPEIQKAYAAQFSLAAVRADVYDDPDVKKAMPFAAELSEAITQAQCPAGVAGVPADLAGDLQERQRGARGSDVARGRDEAGAGGHREGARPSRPWLKPLSKRERRSTGAPAASPRRGWRSSWWRRRWCSSHSSRRTPSSTQSGCLCTSTASVRPACRAGPARSDSATTPPRSRTPSSGTRWSPR